LFDNIRPRAKAVVALCVELPWSASAHRYPAANGYVFKQLKRLGLSDALALQTAPMVKVQAFDAGKRLWTKGNEIKHWMFIIQGLVSASVPTTNSESTPISVYGRGAWFGEQSIINRKPSFADYVCLTATEVLTLPAAQFDQLFVTEPNFARFVAKLMAWRVQKTSETLTLMKLGNPCMRVVMGLAQFAEALAYRSDRPPTIGFGEGWRSRSHKTLWPLCAGCRAPCFPSTCSNSRSTVGSSCRTASWKSCRFTPGTPLRAASGKTV